MGDGTMAMAGNWIPFISFLCWPRFYDGDYDDDYDDYDGNDDNNDIAVLSITSPSIHFFMKKEEKSIFGKPSHKY